MDTNIFGVILILIPLTVVFFLGFLSLVKEKGLVNAICTFGIAFLLIASLSIGTYLLDN